jgi:hypothetical protein
MVGLRVSIGGGSKLVDFKGFPWEMSKVGGFKSLEVGGRSPKNLHKNFRNTSRSL